MAIRVGIGLLILGGWNLFTGLDDASRGDDGEIVSGGDLDVMTLQVGDCFNDPDDLDGPVSDVAAVPCHEEHDNEVFLVQTLDDSFGDAFPGVDVLGEHAYIGCSGPSFDSYVGRSYLDSVLEVFSFTPTEDSWAEGDREFVCALFRLDGAPLGRSASGSGL
ncbi:MAG: septum formation family protein [Acidimicrobiia bacterium]